MRTRWPALALAVAAGLLLVLAGPGTRAGLWGFRTGLGLFRWAAYLGIAAAALSLLALLAPARAGTRAPLVVAFLLAAGAALVPWRWMQRARRAPPIHDITTDTEQPPAFLAVLPLRADAPNAATYGGPDVAAAQREAYPDIGPLSVALPPAAAFDRALDAARAMGWELVSADSAAGRIEATATTPWFGFKDDVVVRLTPDGSGTRVDVRSVSRVGRGDAGANAARIREYLAKLAA